MRHSSAGRQAHNAAQVPPVLPVARCPLPVVALCVLCCTASVACCMPSIASRPSPVAWGCQASQAAHLRRPEIGFSPDGVPGGRAGRSACTRSVTAVLICNGSRYAFAFRTVARIVPARPCSTFLLRNAQLMKTVEFREGDIVARQGDAALTAFILLYGEMVRRRRHICAGTELMAATSDTSRRAWVSVYSAWPSSPPPPDGQLVGFVRRC